MATRHPRRDRRVFRDSATHTRYIVAFHSHEGFDGIVDGSHPLLGKIQAVHTQKAFGGAAGTFSITIKKPPSFAFSWQKLFPDPEGTWVRIAAVVDGHVIAQTWGNVDTITETVQRSGDGARAETYTVNGRDIGKVFEETKVFKNLYNTSSIRSIVGTQRAIDGQSVDGSPDRFMRVLIELWLGNNSMAEKQWELPQSMWSVGGVSFYDALNKTTIQEMNSGNGETFDNSLLNPDQQTGTPLWDILQQYSNGIMNELWVDLAPQPGDLRNLAGLRPAIYLRERMFQTKENSRRWDQLRTRVLELGDVQSRQIAKGGASNRFNYWLMNGGWLGTGNANLELTQDLGDEPYRPGSIPIINSESIRKHGVRPYIVSSDFLPWDNAEGGAGFITLASNWLKRIHDWYAVAHMQLSGTIKTTRVFPEIRVGEKLLERRSDGNIAYYVEGVENSWAYPGPGSTTITVTHGEYEGDKLLDIIYAQYEVPATVTQGDCVELIGPDAQFTTLDKHDDLIAQLAAGCRLATPGVLLDQEQQVLSDPGSFEINGANITQQELQGTNPSGAGLVSEGAVPIERALGIEPDPEMIPNLADIDAGHAEQIATGATTATVPDVEAAAEAEAEAVTLTQQDLEEGRPIPASADDPFADINQRSDDLLAGIEGDLGLP